MEPAWQIRVLKDAKAVIADPEDWWAGPDVGGTGECAVTAVANEPGIDEVFRLLDRAADDLFEVPEGEIKTIVGGDVKEGAYAIWVNDYLGHQAVMQMYDRAVEIAETSGV